VRGLRAQTKLILYASMGGIIKFKAPIEAKALIENMTLNDYKVWNEFTQL